MDQDPHRALGAPEHAGDLGGRHLLDEAQDERPAAVVGQPADRGPCLGGLEPAGRSALDVDGAGQSRRPFERTPRDGGVGCAGRWRPRSGRSGTARPGTSRHPRRRPAGHAPRSAAARRGRAGTSARWRPRRRGGRRARRTRSCTPGRGTSDTGRRTRAGSRRAASTSGRSRSRWTSRRSSVADTFLNTGRAIALHPDRRRAGGLAVGQPEVDDLAGQDGPLRRRPPRGPRRRGRRLDGSTPRARTTAELPSGGSSRTGPPVRQLAGDPAGDVEATRAEAPGPRLEPADEAVEQPGRVDRSAAGGLVQARHRPGELGREVAAGQSALIPMPTIARGSVAPEPDGLAQHAGQLAHGPVAGLDDEVVRPLEADRPWSAARRPPRPRRPSPGRRSPRAARPGRARARSAGTRPTAGARRPAARPTTGRRGRGRRSARRPRPGRPRASRRRARRGRRRSSSRRARTARGG